MISTVQREGLGMNLMSQASYCPAARSLFTAIANWPAASVADARKHRTGAGFPSEELMG